MPLRPSPQGLQWQRRSSRQEWLQFFLYLFVVMLVVLAWQVMTKDTLWVFVSDAPRQAADIGWRMWPPRWAILERLWAPLIETIHIATLGTLLALVVAIPLAFLAATNTTPSVRLVRPLALLTIVASRSINSLIWGLLLVTIVGPGTLAGILAIALRSLGFIGKLLYEGIEEIDQAPIEALSATGASRLQIIDYGVVPQIMPSLVAISLFRWDINIRESTVLGLVGAGGIGLLLESSLSRLAWPEVTVILLAILVTVVISEWLSAQARKSMI
ncbi:MAG TPA: phosphonate ABC transporter, permease protein PhnE [Lautropia sp.]|nr:phosphonate ABC transporter, permease protein PhnE [Lautropia sp.]